MIKPLCLNFFAACLVCATSTTIIKDATAANNHKSHKSTGKKSKNQVSTIISGENRHFDQWPEVQELKNQLQTQHQFPGNEFDRIMSDARYVDSAVQAVKPMPPGKPKNWKVYRSRFVETARVEAGLKFWDRNQATLSKAEAQYGVPAEIIVGLIGVETIYGKNLGRYRAIDAISTLAFAYPDTPNREQRIAFFRNELVQLLLWAREHKQDVLKVKASYAGAIGLCQFMPSSLREFAVDFDGDKKIDLRESEADAIASVANYLAKHGWKTGLPYAFPAITQTLENGSDKNDESKLARLKEMLGRGLKASLKLDEIRAIVTTPSTAAPSDILYGVIDLQNGEDATEYWLATENFYAITQYNRSYFYAMSVIDLAQAISSARTNN